MKMKNKLVLCLFVFLNLLVAQENKTCVGQGASNCGILEVSNRETVHLTFPTKIKYVDLGSSFFVFKIDSTTNLLKIKAKRYDPNEITNLTVVTEDNFLYSFKVKINNNIPVLTYLMEQSNVKVPVLKRNSNDYCYTAVNNPLGGKIFTKKKKGIQLSLLAMYYAEGKYIFTYHIKNKSNIPYEIESLNLVIKRTKSPFRQKIAYQETVLYADDQKCNYKNVIGSGKENIFSLIYPKFYPPKGYHLKIHLNEKMSEYGRVMKKRLSKKIMENIKSLDI